jgi:hypothetical protein
VIPLISPSAPAAELLSKAEDSSIQRDKQPRPEQKQRFWHYLKRWPKPLLLLFLLALVIESALAALAPTDVARYECYGLTFWLGSRGTALLPQAQCAFLNLAALGSQPAFHMLPLEYPPLTILPFSLPLLFPLQYYAFTFIFFMTVVGGLIYWLLLRSGAWFSAPIFLLYLLLGTAAVAQQRFDLLPAACTLICLLAAERWHWRTAYIALAIGVLLKFYPLVMLPPLFLAEQRAWFRQQEYLAPQGSWLRKTWTNVKRWHWSNVLLFVGIVVAVMGGFALLNVQDALISPVKYFLLRPPEVESLVSTVTWLGGSFGAPYAVNFAYGSLTMESTLTHLISPVDTLLSAGSVLVVFWLHWRKRIDLSQALIGLLCVLMTTAKVFSPQYLIWLFPLLTYAYARGKTSRAWMYAWLVISVLTFVIYVGYYTQLIDPLTDQIILLRLPGFFQLVALRNLLMLIALFAFVFGWWGARAVNKPDVWLQQANSIE